MHDEVSRSANYPLSWIPYMGKLRAGVTACVYQNSRVFDIQCGVYKVYIYMIYIMMYNPIFSAYRLASGAGARDLYKLSSQQTLPHPGRGGMHSPRVVYSVYSVCSVYIAYIVYIVSILYICV